VLKIIKNILCGLFITSALCVNAAELTELNIAENKSLILAELQFIKAVNQFEIKTSECSNRGSHALSKSLFHDIELTKKQLEVVVHYFYLKTQTICKSKELNDYLLSSALLSELKPSARNKIQKSKPLFIYDHMQLLTVKNEYLSIPEPKRFMLEKTKELHQLFSLIDSMGSLEL